MKIPASLKLLFQKSIHTPKCIETFFGEIPDSHFLVVFAGRSNVGKSSLLNHLAQQKVAFSSTTPGRTLSINLYTCPMLPNHFFLDTPGAGHASISKGEKARLDSLCSQFFQQLPLSPHVLFHLQDARHPHSKVDLELQRFFASHNLRATVICTKYDKLTTQKERSQLQAAFKNQQYLALCNQDRPANEALVKFILNCESCEPLSPGAPTYPKTPLSLPSYV